MRLSNLTMAVAAAAVVTAAPVAAHAHLVSSSPATNAITPSPKKLTLTFSERLIPAFSKLQLFMPMRGRNVPVTMKTGVGADGRTLIGVPQSPRLMKGAYLVRWTAASFDGHRMTGTLPFRIN